MLEIFQHFFDVFKKRIFFLILVLVLVNGLAILGLIIQKPVYQAQLRFMYVSDGQQMDLLRFSEQLSMPALKTQSQANQFEILRSPVMAQEAYRAWLRRNAEVRVKPEVFFKNIKVQQVGETSLIEVVYRDSNREATLEGLKVFLEAYQANDRKIYLQNIVATKKVIDNYIASLEKKLVGLGANLARYRGYEQLVANSDEFQQQLVDWEKKRQEYEYQAISYQSQLRQIHLQLNGLTNLVPVYKQIDRHPIIYKLLKDQALARQSGASQKKLSEMSQNINKNILKIVAQKTSAWNNQYQSYITYYNDTKNSYENNRAAWLAVKNLIGRFSGYLARSAPDIWQYNKLNKTSEVNLSVYANLLRKREELEIQKATDPGNIRIVENPSVSQKPVAPRVKQMLMLSALLSLILGVGAILGIEVISPSIVLLGHIRSVLKLEPLADLRAHARENIITDPASDSAYAQAIRRLRIFLNSLIDRASTHWVIGLVRFQEGLHVQPKSVGYNLGVSCANTGQKTLLIETDIKNPSLDYYFSPSSPVKLTLDEISRLKKIPAGLLKKTAIAGLSVLRLEVENVHPNDVWEIPNLKKWLRDLKTQYERIFILTPPANLVPQAVGLLDYFDKAILEIPSGFSDVAMIEELKNFASKKQVEILGAYLI
jgi:uncharacterized protein involved in exopolysaccharide biosynthesis